MGFMGTWLCVNETIRDLTQKLDSISLHGYTSAQGDIESENGIKI